MFKHFIVIIFLYTINLDANAASKENIVSPAGTFNKYVENIGFGTIIFKDTLIPKNNNLKDGISLLTKAYGDSVVLRFAPSDYAFWERARNSGFVIKRGKDSLNLKTIATVFPIPFEKIDTSIFSKDSFALMAAGLLYGKVDRSNLQGFMQEYRANQQVLNMSLMVSEFSAQAANILGFRYVDKDVVRGENYYYELSNPVYTSKKYNGTSIVKNVFKPIRPPYQLEISTGDKALTLRWSKDYNNSAFTYYMIERSDDNKNFFLLTERPLVFLKSESGQAVPEFTYTDSFNLVNNTKYYYRLYGGTSFAEFSPATLIEGTPRDLTPPAPPQLAQVYYNDTVHIFNLEWENDFENMAADFAYMQVMVSRAESGPYSALSQKLEITDFNYTHELGPQVSEDMEGRYFFRIDCYDESGNMSSSNFETSFVPDYTNPEVPDSLSGFIDTLGFVNIKWPKSRSKDVRGYWLYWANDPDAEFSLVSQNILTDTTYKYYIEEKSLTKNIYYTLRAEDYAYNRSDAAIVLKLRRRDIVPPVAPFILNINTDSLRMKINITESASDDVKLYQLFRRNTSTTDTSWKMVDTILLKNVYIDQSAQLNIDYQYKLRAIDSTGNIGSYSPIKGGIISPNSNDVQIKDFKLAQDKNGNTVLLNWKFELPKFLENKNYSFVILRSTGQDGVKFYKEFNAESRSYKDENLNNNVLYNYAIRVKIENDLSGALSETKSILIR